MIRNGDILPGLTGVCYIDESGSATRNEDIFIVSGVFALVEKHTSYLNPFRDPIESIVSKLNQKEYKVKELHTTTMHRELEWIITLIKRWIRHCSYLYTIYPYEKPLVVGRGAMTPRIFAESINPALEINLPDRMEMTRKSVLSSAVSIAPVIAKDNKINHFKFILDSEIWRRSKGVIENLFPDDMDIKVDIHLKDSKDVPGIQIADLISNITRLKMLGTNASFIDAFSSYLI